MTPDFTPLIQAFDIAVAHGERGAVCVMHEGHVLLELYAGEARVGQPWHADTLACCFSVTKGVLSLLAHVMIDADMISPDTRIASVWPAFGQNGKADITLLDVLTHRAGLPAVDHPVVPGDLYDHDRMIAHLERSAPVVPARGAPVYHNMTYGHLLGETLCRAAAEPSLPQLLERLVLHALDADFRIGLNSADMSRTAHLTQEEPGALFVSLRDAPDTLFARSMAFFDPAEDFNSVRWRSAVIGSGSGHATARALATLYGQFVWEDGLLTVTRRSAARSFQRGSNCDPVLGIALRLAQGLELSTPPGLEFGPDSAILGHWGAGGAQTLADPRTGITFAYLTGHLADGMGTSPRAALLVRALYAGLNRRSN